MLEAVCCSQAVQGAAKHLFVHPLSASSQAPAPWSHTSPYHCCCFCPLLVTIWLAYGRWHICPQSVPLDSPSLSTLAVSAFPITPITQDENNAKKSSPSYVINVNVPGSLPLQVAEVSSVPFTSTLHSCPCQVLSRCVIPVSKHQSGPSMKGAQPCCLWPLPCVRAMSGCTFPVHPQVMPVSRLWICTCICWKCRLNIEHAQLSRWESSSGSIWLCTHG